MKIYYAHCDWSNATRPKRAFGVLTIGKNGTIGTVQGFYQWYQCYQHKAANNANKIQHRQFYQRGKSHMIQYGEHENVLCVSQISNIFVRHENVNNTIGIKKIKRGYRSI